MILAEKLLLVHALTAQRIWFPLITLRGIPSNFWSLVDWNNLDSKQLTSPGIKMSANTNRINFMVLLATTQSNWLEGVDCISLKTRVDRFSWSSCRFLKKLKGFEKKNEKCNFSSSDSLLEKSIPAFYFHFQVGKIVTGSCQMSTTMGKVENRGHWRPSQPRTG